MEKLLVAIPWKLDHRSGDSGQCGDGTPVTVWGVAHIYFLIGTRSRLAVALSWVWTAATGLHSARLITQKETLKDEV